MDVEQNTTDSSLIEWMDKPTGFLLRIEILVVIAAALLTLLVIFGSYRRRSSSSALKLILWTAYTVPDFLVSYTIGLMESANFRNELFFLWTMFLVIVLGSANSISAYSLDDNDKWRRQKAQQVAQLCWAYWLMNSYSKEFGSYRTPVLIILVLSLSKLTDRYAAFQLASHSYGLVINKKLVADYMHHEHELSNQDEVNPVSMRGYNYLVAGEEKEKENVQTTPPDYVMKLNITDRVITVDKIWRCEGELLTSTGDPDGCLKDICLSFALFKLLRRRFAEYPLAESNLEKTRDFVMRGLLSGDNAHERAFTVIEVELAFLFDSFYTKYLTIFSKGFFMLVTSSLMVMASFWVVVLLFNYNARPDEAHLVSTYGINVDVIITFLVVLSMLGVEVWQIIAYILSDWAKVVLLCKYVEKPSWQGYVVLEKVLGYLCRKRVLKSWENKLGQYSLLNSFGYNPSMNFVVYKKYFIWMRLEWGKRLVIQSSCQQR